jgi:hypothetical protein
MTVNEIMFYETQGSHSSKRADIVHWEDGEKKKDGYVDGETDVSEDNWDKRKSVSGRQ